VLIKKLFQQSCLFLLLSLMTLGLAIGQDNTWRTTDDTRKVPLPPRVTSNDEVLVIAGGTLIDGSKGSSAIENATLVIQGDRIIAVGRSGQVELPDKIDRQINASGLFIVPGLVDLHIHFTQQRGDDFARFRDSDAAAAIRGTLLLGQFLDAGITAVRDVGTRNDVAIRLKEAVERRLVDGPRVLWSGQLIASRGGHADEITSTATGRPKSLVSIGRVRVANGPWDWRLAVREQIRMHADWIKVTAPYTREEIIAAVDEAHLHGIPITVDSFGEFTQWAAEAGIDSVEHPLNLDLDIIKSMARNNTAFVPTLTAFYNVIATGYPPAGVPPGGFYHTMSRKFPVVHEQHIEMVRAAHKAGIRIGVGTDIPFENEWRYPEDYYVELGFLKEAGLTDQELLESATRVGAEILGIGDKLGTLEEGKLADILIIGANPIVDIQNLRDVRHVIADGRVVR
jgi:imidazolonepropionase-like amidohydrolase